MTNLYRIDVKIYATAYVCADSAEEALQKARDLKGDSMELPEGEGFGVPISSFAFDDADRPELSLSPAMTIDGPEDLQEPELVDEGELPDCVRTGQHRDTGRGVCCDCGHVMPEGK